MTRSRGSSWPLDLGQLLVNADTSYGPVNTYERGEVFYPMDGGSPLYAARADRAEDGS